MLFILRTVDFNFLDFIFIHCKSCMCVRSWHDDIEIVSALSNQMEITGTSVCAAINETIIANAMESDSGRNMALGTPVITNAGANTASIQSRISKSGNEISEQASNTACFLFLPISRC